MSRVTASRSNRMDTRKYSVLGLPHPIRPSCLITKTFGNEPLAKLLTLTANIFNNSVRSRLQRIISVYESISLRFDSLQRSTALSNSFENRLFVLLKPLLLPPLR